MEKTLLQQAKAIGGTVQKKLLSDQEYDLCVAWAKGDVSITQIKKVMKFKNANSVSTLISRAFIRAVTNQ